MRNLTATICLTIAVLLGVTGCTTGGCGVYRSCSPQEAADIGIRISMKEHRKELFAAMKNNTLYIAVMCPDPLGYMGYLPNNFDTFFKEYGDRPLIKGEIVVVDGMGTRCHVKSWNKVSNPSERKKWNPIKRWQKLTNLKQHVSK
jgi:hypothetical protein